MDYLFQISFSVIAVAVGIILGVYAEIARVNRWYRNRYGVDRATYLWEKRTGRRG